MRFFLFKLINSDIINSIYKKEGICDEDFSDWVYTI